ncbi:RNA polymerase sigma factor [Portibacter marinus]|uniref:RNA polymerase sigma factor n=1 Tax=Portibacter marinus TaxID=2898660 RepID=UPI001F23FDDB|nr:sigma-70 family RNA polymerase sigma factor [Portibacter marinus]
MKTRDKEAISLLYDYYSDALYGIVTRIVRDEEKAKDVMQDSFSKVWRNIDTYDSSKSKLFTWLLRIFRNTAIDQLRKSKNKEAKDIQNQSRIVSMSSHHEIKPDEMDLSIHLAGLDSKFRTVIEKIYMQGMTHVETSEALKIPLGTVKSRLRLGLTALRRIYLPVILICLVNQL